MKSLLMFVVVLINVGGCSSINLKVEEYSYIPDTRLMDAYIFVDSCIIKGMTGDIPSGHGVTEGYDEEEIVTGCKDDMFILFANTEFKVVEQNRHGEDEVICQSNSYQEINDCVGDI